MAQFYRGSMKLVPGVIISALLIKGLAMGFSNQDMIVSCIAMLAYATFLLGSKKFAHEESKKEVEELKASFTTFQQSAQAKLDEVNRQLGEARTAISSVKLANGFKQVQKTG